jgi:uncharacterized spore protein YtfJ
MSDESKPGVEPAPTPRLAAQIMESLIAAGDVSKVYGAPIRQGESLLIPAAEVLTIGGFGMGSGGGEQSGPGGRPRRGAGGGGGGGGRTLARGVAVIVASPQGVEVKPIVDVTKIALAALTALGFVWASWKGMSKAKGFRGRA